MTVLHEIAYMTSELGRLLGMPLGPSDKTKDTFVGSLVQTIIKHEGTGNTHLRNAEFARLKMLIKNLQEIEQHDQNLIKMYKRALRKAASKTSYFGIRFEVNIAASFIRKRIVFDKGEAPDFTIHHAPMKLYCECGSARIHTSKRNLLRKIQSIVAQKNSKPYCNSATFLCLDITNVFFSRFDTEPPALCLPDRIRDIANTVVSDAGFGSILLFVYLLNVELQRFESNYVRCDKENSPSSLVSFLNQHFPKGSHRVTDYFVPREG